LDLAHTIQLIALYALPVIFAITIHEAAHGYAARYFGDDTAWKMGRVTLNPLKHIDPFGTILLPLVLILISSPFILGAAKPVPVRFGNLRHPKRDMIWVALAGPASNLVQAAIWQTALILLSASGVSEPFLIEMCQGGIVVNLVLFAFNLIPLPPLDGGRILVGLLPTRQAMLVARVEPWGFMLLIAIMIFLPSAYSLWMRPVIAVASTMIDIVLTPLILLIQ
jgi:Zn-dependent protease